MEKIGGNIIDIFNRTIFPGEIHINNGRISDIIPNTNIYSDFICPGFIDSHVHIESSMLIPEQFSKMVVTKGTVAVINDPHEIANISGIEGIQFMIENSYRSSVKTFFGIPSCVPATPFDSAGCIISAQDVYELANSGNFILLSEVMNVPGVLNNDPEVLAKLNIAKQFGLKIDGHAPNLFGEELIRYIESGISTDHECMSLEDAKEKVGHGMRVLIREGSAAKNYEALKSLIKTNPNQVMFCTDDSHPDELISEGHIDKIVKRAVRDGFDLFDVLKIASVNPVFYYDLPVGLLRKGDFADFIRIENLDSFKVLSVYIDGVETYHFPKKEENDEQKAIFTNHTCNNKDESFLQINNFNHDIITMNELRKKICHKISGIKVMNGELVTSKFEHFLPFPVDNFESDIEQDILKIVYINRYTNAAPQISFIQGFHLKQGAFASSISHDSHNILAVGCSDSDILDCVNAIIRKKGGLAIKNSSRISLLPLPIGGIMTDKDGYEVASLYRQLNFELKRMGCRLDSPFMTLSFMSLIVIPEVKIGEKGLFDFNSFCFLEEEEE